MKVLIVFGTRPEILKLYPVIRAFEESGESHNVRLLNTGQHKEILDPFLELLDITASDHLSLLQEGQSLSGLTSRAFLLLQQYIDVIIAEGYCPDVIIAQGDTTTVMATSVVAFYNRIPFAHVEAGLRSFDYENPFPEELNRKIASLAARYHFAPTDLSRANLLKEGIEAGNIYVVGNTIIDAVERMREKIDSLSFSNPELQKVYDGGNVVLITCHRRENHGSNLRNIIKAVAQLAIEYKDLHFLWPVHPNPNVKTAVQNASLSSMPNVSIVEPINYTDILKIYGVTKIIITDSGGLQEEAPSFGIPVIVIRKTTERPEAMLCGYSKLAGADTEEIISTFRYFMEAGIAIKHNPFGDGQASRRIVSTLTSN